ncbi:MAG: sugar phosphate isomerase/epimerase, partial [Chloroflexota bacterium]|nr:sugar phosphate isomerase/epimerase [Chloroflexota bacterium]
MKVGMMNDPAVDPVREARWAAEHGFDFIDLTLEGPGARVDKLDVAGLGTVLRATGLGIVGHTAWYLPLASPFQELRTTARDLYRRALDAFADAGVELVNVHPDGRVPLHNRDQMRKMNAEAIGQLAQDAAQLGITVMVENLDRNFSDVDDLKPVLD